MYESLFLNLLVDTEKQRVSQSLSFFLSIISCFEFFPPIPIALFLLHVFSYILPLSSSTKPLQRSKASVFGCLFYAG